MTPVFPTEAVDDAAGDGSEPAPPERSRLLVGVLVLVVVAALFLAVSAVVWWRADHDADRALAQTRDVVLVDAERDVAVLTTLDYRSVSAGLSQWRAVSTGTLGKQLGSIDDSTSKALADAGKVTTGKVIDMALTSVNPSKASASAIASVEISVKDKSGSTDVKRDRFTVELERVGGRWRVAAFDQLPVGLS